MTPALVLLQVKAEAKRTVASLERMPANWSGVLPPKATRTHLQPVHQRWPADDSPSPDQDKVAVLQGSRTTGASREGDAIQGLVFSVICLIIVAGIYFIVVKEYPASSEHEPSWRDSPLKRSSVAGSTRALPPPGHTRGHSLLGRRPIGSGLPSGQQLPLSLPTICPLLMINSLDTPIRLAVPVEPLTQSQFEVDVLGLSGHPLLSAALLESNGSRDIRISVHNLTLVAIVTSAMELLGADGQHFGKLTREPGESTHVLLDQIGRPILTLTRTHQDTYDSFSMTSTISGRVVERATAVRRPKGSLPAEHYEIVANPNVDSVLVLAVFLAVVVFDPIRDAPSSSLQPLGATPSGRLSSQSLAGAYGGPSTTSRFASAHT